jgi:hypothetical protein
VLGEILDECERTGHSGEIDGRSPRTAELPFEQAIDVTMAASLGSRRAIEELAFIAQLELRQRAERLERVQVGQGAAPLLGEADSSLRRIRKTLSAVEAAIAGAQRVPARLVFTSELEVSRAIRRSYAKFRARLHADQEPTPQTLQRRFRAAGTQIAMLVGWDVYPEMRVRDRLLLRDLQQRILAWLRDADRSIIEGLRVWQDLAACTEMFSLVSRRQELVEHDTQVVERLSTHLEHASQVDAYAWAELAALEGLDRELDGLLAAQPAPGAAIFRRVVARLSSTFARPACREEDGVSW